MDKLPRKLKKQMRKKQIIKAQELSKSLDILWPKKDGNPLQKLQQQLEQIPE